MANNTFQCRICAKLNCEEPQNIFEQPEGKLLRHIEQVTGVKLKNSKYLPRHICSGCLIDLRQARAFRRRCIKSQIYFKTSKYKSTGKKYCDEGIPQRNINVKAVQAEQDNVVGTSTTTIDKQYSNKSMKATVCEFLHDEETPVYENDDDHLSHENSTILDVKKDDVALSPTADYETVEFEFTKCEEETSNAASSSPVKSTSTVAEANIGNYNKAVKQLPKKRSITEYMCEQCGNTYDNVNAFRTHLNRHAGIKPFQCGSCPSKFYTKSEVKLHYITHSGERPFECKYCGRKYATSGGKLMHERLHTNERPYKCTFCPKDFRSLRNLKDHLLTHTKERKFECTICDKYFQRHTHLVAHNRSQLHKENVDKLENLSDVEYTEITIEPQEQI